VVVLGVLLLLVLAMGAACVPWRFRTWLILVGGLGVALGILGFWFLFAGPKDYLTRWPFLVDGFHPYRVSLYSAVALLLGMSAWLGLAIRSAFRSPRLERGA